MEHFFELPVQYKGKELLLNGRLVTFSFVYKFHIMVEEQELIFERDDSGDFRVVVPGNNKVKSVNPELVANIISALEHLQAS